MHLKSWSVYSICWLPVATYICSVIFRLQKGVCIGKLLANYLLFMIFWIWYIDPHTEWCTPRASHTISTSDPITVLNYGAPVVNTAVVYDTSSAIWNTPPASHLYPVPPRQKRKLLQFPRAHLNVLHGWIFCMLTQFLQHKNPYWNGCSICRVSRLCW